MSDIRVETITLLAKPNGWASELFLNDQKLTNVRSCSVDCSVHNMTRVVIEFVGVKADVFLPLDGKFKLVPVEEDEQ